MMATLTESSLCSNDTHNSKRNLGHFLDPVHLPRATDATRKYSAGKTRFSMMHRPACIKPILTHGDALLPPLGKKTQVKPATIQSINLWSKE